MRGMLVRVTPPVIGADVGDLRAQSQPGGQTPTVPRVARRVWSRRHRADERVLPSRILARPAQWPSGLWPSAPGEHLRCGAIPA